MKLDTALSALCVAVAVAWVGLRIAHPRRSPKLRMSLYLEAPRVHLGGLPGPSSSPVVAREALRRVLGPLAARALGVAERLVRVAPAEELEASLRQAGMAMGADTYRREYLRWLVGAPVVMGALGALTGHGIYVVLFFAAGLFSGARRLPERVKAKTKRRSERIRSDLPTVAAVLALKIDNNKSLVVAVTDLVAQGSGPVVDDLQRAVHLMNAGYGEAAAFELIAREAAEPTAGRFYRFLAAAAAGAVDLAKALL
ncbi:MAG: hypothetical protein ACRDZX_01975, partial [Acidimicrobiales bacterium]